MNERKDMILELATLEAHRREIGKGRKELHAECAARSDALGPAIETVAEHPDLDEAGFLGHCYHKTLLAEHQGYREILDSRESRGSR